MTTPPPGASSVPRLVVGAREGRAARSRRKNRVTVGSVRARATARHPRHRDARAMVVARRSGRARRHAVDRVDRRAAERLVAEGFRRVYNLEGGIDAWSAKVDPSVARY